MKGIKALARHLDISIGTVSRALNGRPDVNPETRARVMEAARAMGYTPNQSGRSLRQGVTNTIGFMIEMSPNATASSDDFFMGVFEGVQTVLTRHKLDLVVFPCPVQENSVDYLSRIVGRGLVDAMIISATRRHDDRVKFLDKAQIPFIALGRSESGPNMRWVDLDFEGVATSSIKRLAAQGHRRIALAIPADDINLGHVFHDAYRAALKAEGLAYDPTLVFHIERALEGGYDLAQAVTALPDRPTAILLSSEVMSLNLYRGLQERGIRPGRELAVIGFRNNPRAGFLMPSLTCHSVSLSQLGQTLAETLLAGMPAFAALYPGRDRNLIWPKDLVKGESDAFVFEPGT